MKRKVLLFKSYYNEEASCNISSGYCAISDRFFNSLSETFDASFYFEFEDPLEQSFDKEKMRRRLAFMPMFLRPGFCGVKNLRLDVWKVLSISSFDVVLISEYNLLGLLVLLHKWLFRKRVKIYTICDDNVDMAKSVGIIKKFTRFILLNFIDGTILADKKPLIGIGSIYFIRLDIFISLLSSRKKISERT